MCNLFWFIYKERQLHYGLDILCDSRPCCRFVPVSWLLYPSVISKSADTKVNEAKKLLESAQTKIRRLVLDAETRSGKGQGSSRGG